MSSSTPTGPVVRPTSAARKGLRIGVRAGFVTSSDHCPRLAPPVLRTSVQYPYE